MTRLVPAFALAMPATPALAHQGLHLHPHGVDAVWAILATTLCVAGIAIASAIAVRRRK